MEPDKIDKIFKSGLTERELNPSENAWAKLDLLLDQSEKIQRKRVIRVWWLVAASVIAVFFLGYKFAFQADSGFVVPNEQLVVEPSKDLDNRGESKNIQSKADLSHDSKSDINQIPQVASEKQKRSHLVSLNAIEKSGNTTIEAGQIKSSEIIYKSDESIDSLLNQAEYQLANQSSGDSKKQIIVDPAKLLNQVDTELEPSFREKVIHKVTQNFQAVKVAIANRNVVEEKHP